MQPRIIENIEEKIVVQELKIFDKITENETKIEKKDSPQETEISLLKQEIINLLDKYILPLIFIRPFSGSAANGVMAEVIHDHGGNSYAAHLAATIMGSTETTFYVIAVYMGAVAIRRTRYAIPAGLIADIVGVIASIVVCNFLFNK